MNERSHAPLRIMIVDDHAGFRELMRGYFPPPQYHVEECMDGTQALPMYRRFRPDWVLMDFAMKGLDGLVATQGILTEFPDARVLMVTEHLDAALSAAASRAGARGFVGKDNLAEVRRLVSAPEPPSSAKRTVK